MAGEYNQQYTSQIDMPRDQFEIEPETYEQNDKRQQGACDCFPGC